MFKECKSLKTLNIPEGVKNIEFGAFKDCTNLNTISVPSTLRSIDYCVFEYCDSISSITYNGTVANFNKIEVGKYNGTFTTASVNGSSQTKSLKGDVNGDGSFNIADVSYYQKSLAKVSETDNMTIEDFNADGIININDVTAMQKNLVKLG